MVVVTAGQWTGAVEGVANSIVDTVVSMMVAGGGVPIRRRRVEVGAAGCVAFASGAGSKMVRGS